MQVDRLEQTSRRCRPETMQGKGIAGIRESCGLKIFLFLSQGCRPDWGYMYLPPPITRTRTKTIGPRRREDFSSPAQLHECMEQSPQCSQNLGPIAVRFQEKPGNVSFFKIDSLVTVIYIYKEDCLSVSVSVSVLLSQCIRSVFKIRSSNFSYRSRTFRSRSWRGWRFYGTPWGSEIKG